MRRLTLFAILWLATISVAQAAAWPAGCIQPIAIGQTISGTLTTSDCYWSDASGNRYYADIYTFNGTAGQQVAIAMSSAAVDAELYLYNVNDSSATPLAYDDDGGGGTNARIPSASGYFTLPTTATYYIVADSVYAAQTGAYTLALTTGSGSTDTTPPTAPANLTATAASSTEINLTFTASTDAGGSGLAGYKVEICEGAGCTGFSQIGTVTATNVRVTGLTPGTTYVHRVRAYDNAGNNSAYSNTAAATTPSSTADTTPPTTPGSLAASAASSSAVNLTWSASTDAGGSGLAGYKVERCSGASCTAFNQVGTATSASYADSGLVASTSYSYRVRAYDNAGNNSAYSNTASATTSGTTIPPVTLPPGEMTVSEFYHPSFDHYFITAYQAEAASLAAGNLPPWVPTGKTFKVWSGEGTNVSKVWRFFSTSFAPKSSHFYTNNPTEAASLIAGRTWSMEADNAFYMMASPTGTCPSATTPLYRLYNNGQGGAPNHRYTIDPAVRTQMIAARWVPEGNGADGVFACVPLGTSLPPPTGSPFQLDVMNYTNRILGFASGDIANLDQISLILSAGISSLLNPGSTCPVATSVPPLENLETFPPTLTITFDFGSGCAVTGDTGTATVAGKGVIVITNLVVSETSIAGNVTITLTSVKVNGVAVADGAIGATFNVNVNAASETPTYSGTITITLTRLMLTNGVGVDGTVTIRLDTGGTTIVSTDLISSPNSVAIKLNGVTMVPQADGSVLVNTTAASTVGAYSVTVSNVKIDSAVCQTGAIGGSISFTKGGQTGTVTFDSTCNYTYTGP